MPTSRTTSTKSGESVAGVPKIFDAVVPTHVTGGPVLNIPSIPEPLGKKPANETSKGCPRDTVQMTSYGPVPTTHDAAKEGEDCDDVLELVALGFTPVDPGLNVTEKEDWPDEAAE